MPRLIRLAVWLACVGLWCDACSLDVAPAASGVGDMRGSAGHGEAIVHPAATTQRDLWVEQEPAPVAGSAADAGAAEPQGAAVPVMAAALPANKPAAAGAMAPPPIAGHSDATRMAQAGAAAPESAGHGGQPAAGARSMASPRCVPGNYVGTFGGTVQLIGLPVLGITGTVVAELVANQAGDSLAIASSRIEGMANEQSSVTAKLVGIVNCTTLQLEGGALEHGLLTTPNVLGESSTMTFSGKAEATYSSSPAALQGTWQAAPDSALSGSGSWSIALALAAQ